MGLSLAWLEVPLHLGKVVNGPALTGLSPAEKHDS